MIRYLEWGESNLTAVVYNTILNSSASVCVSASPQWAPHIWALLPSFCSSSHNSLTAQKEIDPSPKSSGKSSLPLIWQQVLREGGEEGWGWEWAKGLQFCHRDLPQLTGGIWQHFTVQWKVLRIQQPEPLILQCISHLFEVSECCNASFSGWQNMAALMLTLLSKGKAHLWLNLPSETLHTRPSWKQLFITRVLCLASSSVLSLPCSKSWHLLLSVTVPSCSSCLSGWTEAQGTLSEFPEILPLISNINPQYICVYPASLLCSKMWIHPLPKQHQPSPSSSPGAMEEFVFSQT